MKVDREDSHAPRIGVSWITPGDDKGERYMRAVSVAGGTPVPLLADGTSWAGDLATIRGLILTGGGDIAPERYGEGNLGPSLAINRRRDDFELSALRFCLDRGLPVLAICRGLQLTNVALGGSLLQDIHSPIVHRAINGRSSFHEVELSPGTRLSTLLGARHSAQVNSRHHQGVDLPRLAPRLRVSALSTDGIVEGLELEGDQFLLAVQCHPEYLDQVPHLGVLFTALLETARTG